MTAALKASAFYRGCVLGGVAGSLESGFPISLASASSAWYLSDARLLWSAWRVKRLVVGGPWDNRAEMPRSQGRTIPTLWNPRRILFGVRQKGLFVLREGLLVHDKEFLLEQKSQTLDYSHFTNIADKNLLVIFAGTDAKWSPTGDEQSALRRYQ